MNAALRIGAKVRIKDYPVPARQSAPFTYNGLVGQIIAKERTGSNWDGQPAYTYLVHFTQIEVPYSNLNPETNKLDRGIKVTDAENWFESLFLEPVYEAPAPLPPPPPSNIITPQ